MTHRRTGYFKVSRQLFDEGEPFWDDARPFRRREAWLDLIQSAAWRRRSVTLPRGSVTLARGEFVVSVRVLAERWHWSIGAVSQFLTALVARESLRATRVACATQVYAVVNYDAYQSDITPDGDQAEREHSRPIATDSVPIASTDDAAESVNCGEHSNEHSNEHSDEGSREHSGEGLTGGTLNDLAHEDPSAREHSQERSDERPNERSNEHNREGNREGRVRRSSPRGGAPRSAVDLVVTTGAAAHAAVPPANDAVRPGRSAAARYPNFSAADCDALYEQWTETWGAVDYGRFRKALAPLVPRYTVAQLLPAIVAHREICEVEDKFAVRRPSPEAFAAGAVEWVRIGAMDYADENGAPTERMRRALAVPA